MFIKMLRHTKNINLSVLTLIVYRPGSKTIGEGISPFGPDTVTNCGSSVGLKTTLAL